MNTPKKKRVKLEIVTPQVVATAIERVVIVVAAAPEHADSVARSFATQGEPVRVMWFEQARQVLASGLQKALAGVIVCHRAEQVPEGDLTALRRALPDTPVLAWQVA